MSIAMLREALKDLVLVELGQFFEERMPNHPSHSKFYKTVWHSFDNGDPCYDCQLIFNDHNGTHLDSPGHYINRPGYPFVDALALEGLCGECVTVDASFLAPRTTLEAAHLAAWEAQNGALRRGDIVLLDFDWMKRWALRPDDRAFASDYPGLGETGARYLVERGVKLVGVDTLSVDADGALGDPAHNTLLGNRVPVVENLRNLPRMRGKRGWFAMLPLLLRDGSSSPVRPVVLLERE